jgi:hypothetical protein
MRKLFFICALASVAVACSTETTTSEEMTVDTTMVAPDTTVVAE